MTVAIASEQSIASMKNLGLVVVGNNSLPLQNIIQLGILYMRMVANATSRRQYNTSRHTSFAEHFGCIHHHIFINMALASSSLFYTITTGSGTSESTTEFTSQLWLSSFDIVNDNAQDDTKVGSWATGKHYVFYITLDANPIVFGATITDWTSGNGYYYLVQ